MSSITITAATDEEVASGDLGRRLRLFNYDVVGEYRGVESIRLSSRASDGSVVGGFRGFVFMDCLRIELLWVDAAIRGEGLGSNLLKEAERIARESVTRNRPWLLSNGRGPICAEPTGGRKFSQRCGFTAHCRR